MTAGNFSQAPGDALHGALSKNYTAVHVEQGVPVLDRDLNLLGDLISETVRQILRRHIGDGVAGSSDFAIQASADPLDFIIDAGNYLAGGFVVSLATNATYKTQIVPATASPAPPLPALTASSAGQPNPRIDTVYLDVWLDEIDDSADPALGNPSDVGMRTSIRTKVQFVVRVAENANTPPAAVPAQHHFFPLAQLSRPAAGAYMITDQRQTNLSIAQTARRLATIESVFSPVIVSVAPNVVLPGQSNAVYVTGSNLNLGGATVMMGSVAGVVDPASTSTTLVVHVPSNAIPGMWQLTVQTALGAPATAPVPFTINPLPPPPAFADPSGATPQIAPSHAAASTASAVKQITLNGSHFLGVNRVSFDTVPPVYAVPGGDLVSVSDSAIQVNVPVAMSNFVGSAVTITVSVDGVSAMTATSKTLFTVDPQPILTPTWGPTGSQINPKTQSHGNPVTLSGTNFGTSTATTSVKFFGTNVVQAALSDFVSVSPTTIVVKVPAALTVAPAPGNKSKIAVTVQSVEGNFSDDQLTVT